jgi:hypothetical protein
MGAGGTSAGTAVEVAASGSRADAYTYALAGPMVVSTQPLGARVSTSIGRRRLDLYSSVGLAAGTGSQFTLVTAS